MTVRQLMEYLSDCTSEEMDCDIRVHGSLFDAWDIEIDDEEEDEEEY